MANFRVTITPINQPDKVPDQFFSPTMDGAKKELENWAKKGHHGRYRIVETVERVVEEGEC